MMYSVNGSTDVSALEVTKGRFLETARRFHCAVCNHEQTINRLKMEQNKKDLMEEMDEKASNVEKRKRNLNDQCAEFTRVNFIHEIISKAEEISSAFNEGRAKVLQSVRESNVEMDLATSKLDFQELLNLSARQYDDLERKFQFWKDKKQVLFKEMEARHETLKIAFGKIVDLIPNNETARDNFIDFDKLQNELEKLKLEEIQREFQDQFRILRSQLEQCDDTAQESGFNQIMTVANDFSKRFETLHSKTEALKKKYVMTKEGRLARSMKAVSSPIKRLGDLDVLKLPMKLDHKDENKMFRSMSLGEPSGIHIPVKIIMMVGMCGAGKSLMINNIVNFVFGVNCEDNFRFKLIVEEDELAERTDGTSNKAEAMTRWVTSYRLNYTDGFRVRYSLILIDTPGFSDTRGVQYDEQTVESLKAFFNVKVVNVNELSSIGLVVQSSQARLTPEQTYVFNSVLNIFGNDVKDNICLLLTFADAQEPPALATVRKEGIPFPEEGVFKFNNSAVFAPNNTDDATKYYWNFGFDSLRKFFTHIEGVQPASLKLTKEVLKEREHLHLLLDGLRKRIDGGFDKLVVIEGTTTVIMRLKGTIAANKGHKVKKTVHPQEIKDVDHDITNCKPCMFTCHDPCFIKGDKKQGCASMSGGKCVACPGKCPWESHTNGTHIYVYTKMEIEETVEEMAHKYNIAIDDKAGKVKILKKLKSEYKAQKDELFFDIGQACLAAKRLEVIGLGKSILTSVAYIQRLIDSEEKSNRPNKANRIEQLKAFKEKAELLADARQDKLLEKLSAYERTVMEAIIKAEAEEFDEEMKEEETKKKKSNWRDYLPTL